MSEVDIVGLRVADPDAVHPLLERLGARHADALDLLDAPALRDAVANSVADAQSGVDVQGLVDTVLRLVGAPISGRVNGPGSVRWRCPTMRVAPGAPPNGAAERAAARRARR